MAAFPFEQLLAHIPAHFLELAQKLTSQGFHCAFVGGAIRDLILGRPVSDFDLATSARPEELKALFHRDYSIVDTGIEHGTITVVFPAQLTPRNLEITSYRKDIELRSGDHRHPARVEFGQSLEDDLARRDFTINALALCLDGKLIDLYGGLKDLEAQKIRCVGTPEKRFDEDALRMLRALRFASILNFSLDEEIDAALRKMDPLLDYLSVERIEKECEKFCLGESAPKLFWAYPNVWKHVFKALPEWVFSENLFATSKPQPSTQKTQPSTQQTTFAPQLPVLTQHHAETFSQFKESLSTLWPQLPYAFEERFTLLFYLSMLNGLNLSAFPTNLSDTLLALHASKQRVTICSTIAEAMLAHLPTQAPEIKTFVAGRPNLDFPRYLAFASSLAAWDHFDLLELPWSASDVFEAQRCYTLCRERGDAFTVKDLQISGKDLIASGLRPSPQIGEILNQLLLLCFEKPELNEREQLLEISKKLAENKPSAQD